MIFKDTYIVDVFGYQQIEHGKLKLLPNNSCHAVMGIWFKWEVVVSQERGKCIA